MIDRNNLVYLPVFLMPFVVRLLPELRFEYALGPDTPTYMSAMKYGLFSPYEQTNIFYLLIRGLGSIGADSMLFFKIFPSVVFALTCAALAVFARRTYGWNDRSLLLFSFTYSFAPALLHMSWTLHREVFAIFLFSIVLVVGSLKVRGDVKWILISLLYVLIAFTHEFIFAFAVAFLALRFLRLYYRRRERNHLLLPIAVTAIGVSLYSLVRFDMIKGLLNSVFVYEYHPPGVVFSVAWQRFDWWLSLGLLTFGLLIPIAILGFFVDDAITLWFLVTIVPYASFALSYLSFNEPERWLYLASIPISFYAANFLRKLDPRRFALYGILVMLAIQPLSMIGVMPLPLSLYADKRYGTFADALNPSLPPAQIKALQLFHNKISGSQARVSFMVVPNNSSFIWWTEFYFPNTGVYGFGTSQARSLMQSEHNLLYIAYEGTPPIMNPTSKILISYGGLDLYSLG